MWQRVAIVVLVAVDLVVAIMASSSTGWLSLGASMLAFASGPRVAGSTPAADRQRSVAGRLLVGLAVVAVPWSVLAADSLGDDSALASAATPGTPCSMRSRTAGSSASGSSRSATSPPNGDSPPGNVRRRPQLVRGGAALARGDRADPAPRHRRLHHRSGVVAGPRRAELGDGLVGRGRHVRSHGERHREHDQLPLDLLGAAGGSRLRGDPVRRGAPPARPASIRPSTLATPTSNFEWERQSLPLKHSARPDSRGQLLFCAA